MKQNVVAVFFMSLVAVPCLEANDNSPLDPVNAMFDGMRAGSSDQILAAFIDGATLARVGQDGEMRPPRPAARFAAAIGKYNAGEVDEQIFDVEIQQHENLASAWAPYTLFVKGKLVGCGVNHFRLVKKPEGWKIADLVDTSLPAEKCQ